AYCCQVSSPGSSSTGCPISYRSTAAASASGSASCRNFGECTPMVTSTSAYLSSSGRSSSSTCRQLTQQKVQKSSRTMRPRSSARDSGRPPVFSQPRPRSSGARTLTRERGDSMPTATSPSPAQFPPPVPNRSASGSTRRTGPQEVDHRVELALDIAQPALALVGTAVDPVETAVHLVQPAVHLFQPAVDRVETVGLASLHRGHLGQPTVELVLTVGLAELDGGYLGQPSVELVESIVLAEMDAAEVTQRGAHLVEPLVVPLLGVGDVLEQVVDRVDVVVELVDLAADFGLDGHGGEA